MCAARALDARGLVGLTAELNKRRPAHRVLIVMPSSSVRPRYPRRWSPMSGLVSSCHVYSILFLHELKIRLFWWAVRSMIPSLYLLNEPARGSGNLSSGTLWYSPCLELLGQGLTNSCFTNSISLVWLWNCNFFCGYWSYYYYYNNFN